MSRRGKIRLAVSFAVALVVLVPLCLRWHAQWQLNAYRKKLIAAGEKLTVAELAPKRNPEATNTAPFLKLASALPPLYNNAPGAMRSVKPGVARVAWRQPRCLKRTDDSKPAIDVWPVFADSVRSNEPALGEVAALLDAGGIEFINDSSQPNFDVYNFVPSVRNLVIDLDASAMLALHEGRMQEAYHDLESSGAVLQLIAKDPFMIEQLVSYALVSIEIGDFWEALQYGGWTDEQLAQWQHQWEQTGILRAAESSLAMERARGPMMFQRTRSSRHELNGLGIKDNADIFSDFLLDPRQGMNEMLTSYPRYWGWRWIWSYRDEQRFLEIMQTTIEVTRDAQKRRSKLFALKDRKASATRPPPKTTNFDFAGALTGNNELFVGLALRAQTEANIVTAAIALERFRLAHHAYPADLGKLAPEFVQAVPIDCMDGHDLRYRLNPDGTYLLYSVGDDGVDNGGDSTPEKGKGMFFLDGRDFVWPRPATAEELRAYDAEQSKPKKNH
jgi:hypothetical protein